MWPAPFDEAGALARVEILIRRDPALAASELVRRQDVFTSPGARFGYQIASAQVQSSIPNLEAAGAMLAAAASIVPHLGQEAAARLAYHQARLHLLRGHSDPSSAHLRLPIESGTPDLQIAALLLRSQHHAALESCDAQIADLRAALDLFERAPAERDVALGAAVIRALLDISVEVCDRGAIDQAEKSFESLSWTADLQSERFFCTRTLAWEAFLQGQSARAQWLFKDSKEIATTTAWKVMAHLDRAFVARMNLNEIWANEELLCAHKLARGVKWAQTTGDERKALSFMAALFSETDMAQAQRYISMCVALSKDETATNIQRDRRAQALEDYTAGRVQQVLGNQNLAERHFQDAYKVLDELRHHFRAALCAWGLSEVTGSSVWHERAIRHAEYFPRSPLYERIADCPPLPEYRDPFAGITALQREIALALYHGMKQEELPERFGRAPSAIAKQVDAVYTAFGVGTSEELTAALRRRGVSP